MDKILNSLADLEFSEHRIKFLRSLNYFLWILAIFVSYKSVVQGDIAIDIEISWNSIFKFLLEQGFIDFFKWLIFMVCLILTIRYILLQVIPQSKFAIVKCLNHGIPQYFKRAMLNSFYKCQNATEHDLLSAAEFGKSISSKDQLLTNLRLIGDIAIKSIIVFAFSFNAKLASLEFISIFAIVFLSILLCYCIFGLIIVNCIKVVDNRINPKTGKK
jgi:hypothetical protein